MSERDDDSGKYICTCEEERCICGSLVARNGDKCWSCRNGRHIVQAQSQEAADGE